MSEVAKQTLLLAIGSLLLLLNKPLAEALRGLHKELSGERYQENGTGVFRLSAIIVGAFFLAAGISLFFA